MDSSVEHVRAITPTISPVLDELTLVPVSNSSYITSGSDNCELFEVDS